MNSGWFFVIFLTIIKLCLSDESGGLMGVNIAVTSLKVKSYDAWLATRQKMSVEAQKAMMHASGTTQWIAFQQLPAKSTAATEKPSNVVHELSYLAGDGAKFNDFHPLSLAEGGYYYTAASQGHVDGDLSTAMTMKNLNISFVQGWQELLLTHRPGDIFTMSTHRSLSFSQWQEFLTTPMKHLDTSVDKQDQTLSVFESIFVRSGVQLVMAGVVSDRLGVTIILFCFFGQNEQSAEMFSHSYQDLINVKLNKWYNRPQQRSFALAPCTASVYSIRDSLQLRTSTIPTAGQAPQKLSKRLDARAAAAAAPVPAEPLATACSVARYLASGYGEEYALCATQIDAQRLSSFQF